MRDETVITIEKAISRAIEIRGPEVLCKKHLFCAILEDLAPQLSEELCFFRHIYTDGLGELLVSAEKATNSDKVLFLQEARCYLLEKCGYTDVYRDRIYVTFRRVFIDHMFEVKTYKDCKTTAMHLKRFYGDQLTKDVIRDYVEQNRLFMRFSLTEDDIMDYLGLPR